MNFTHFNTPKQISKNFNVDIQFLLYIINKKYLYRRKEKTKVHPIFGKIHIMQRPKYISTLRVPKKNKKRKKEYREVLEIQPPYNMFYKELLYEIEQLIGENKSDFITENSNGFIKGKSILSNAKPHLNKQYIFKIDIKNFFNSIDIDGVKKVFLKLGCTEASSEVFSKLCTYKGVLKEGYNTSPMLANLHCFELDNELIKLSDKYLLNYTRYSDDITFSSNTHNFPTVDELKKIFNKYDFNLNKDKTLLLKNGQSQYVTGLSISNPLYPRIPRRTKRKIRQDLYQLEKYFYDENIEIEHKLRNVYGKIVYVLGIEKDLGKKFKKQFLEILNEHDYNLTDLFYKAPIKLNDQVFHYTDESDIKINNKHYIALSVVTIFSEDLRTINKEKLNALKEEIVTDFRNGLSDNEKNKLFHYSEDKIFVKV